MAIKDGIDVTNDADIANSLLLHARWTLLHACAYDCPYCDLPTKDNNCVFVKERLLRIAHNILKMPRPFYDIVITGGEPVLHPFLPDVVQYLLMSSRSVFVTLETNGSETADYYRQLASSVPSGSLRVSLTVHPAYAEIGNITNTIQVIAGAGQYAHVRLMYDYSNIGQLNAIAESLINLRSIIPFSCQICSVSNVNNGAIDQQHMNSYREWERKTADNLTKTASGGPKIGESGNFPFARLARQGHVSPEAARGLQRNFRNFYCCIGSDVLRVEPDGSFYGAMCDYAPWRGFLWDENNSGLNIVPTRCRRDVCANKLDLSLPKFRSRDEAFKWASARQKAESIWQCEAAPLPDPVTFTITAEDSIRQKIKCITQPTSECIPIKAVPDVLVDKMPAVAAVWSACDGDANREFFLHCIKG